MILTCACGATGRRYHLWRRSGVGMFSEDRVFIWTRMDETAVELDLRNGVPGSCTWCNYEAERREAQEKEAAKAKKAAEKKAAKEEKAKTKRHWWEFL